MSEIQNAIEVKNLKKGFGGRVLFENFSLNVKANTIHAIIGPNGSGKTTLLLLDVNLRDQSKNSGIDLIEKIYNKKPKTKVAMLSSYDMPVYRQEALKRGAVSYIDKSASADELVKKLTAISKGHKSTTPPLLDPLTDREAEIIKAIGTGKTKHEIAQELYISERTLYNHIQSIYDKLGAKNAIEAYNKAIALGYITPLI